MSYCTFRWQNVNKMWRLLTLFNICDFSSYKTHNYIIFLTSFAIRYDQVILFCPWNSLGQNTGVVSVSLLQGIFPTQGLNPGLPHCRQVLFQLSHKGSPRILEWVCLPFSSRSSQPRNRIRVSCIAGEFFTNWAIGKGPYSAQQNINALISTISRPGQCLVLIVFFHHSADGQNSEN